MPKRTPIRETDDLDTLSAIWILSCNDDNPIMTYKSIAHRLSLPEGFDVKAQVRGRPELFRPGILKSRLDHWKSEMRSGKSRPGWLVEIRDQKLQQKAIDDITREDVFRNQFRIETSAPKCDVELIEWGLRHIERLRRDWAEERDGKFKRLASLWLPLVSLAVAGLSVGVTGFSQWKSIESQVELKHYEVSFRPKQESYATFMHELMLAAISANRHDEEGALDHLNRMESAYYQFEPFLTTQLRIDVYGKLDEFAAACLKFAKGSTNEKNDNGAAFINKAAELKTYFRTDLFSSLFEPSS